MIRYLFITLFFIGLLYFVFKRRRFDFFTLGYLSAGVYFLPGFFGFVKFPSAYGLLTEVKLVPGAFVVMITVVVSILVGAVLYDLVPHRTHINVVMKGTHRAAEWACLMAFFGLILTAATTGAALLSPDKNEMLAKFNRWVIFWEAGASLAVLYAYARRQWWIVAFATILLLGDVYIGVRVSFALTILALFTVFANDSGRQRLALKQFRLSLAGAAAVVFLFVYKPLYVAVKQGNWSEVGARIMSPHLFNAAVTGSEPFITQSILNEVLLRDFSVGMDHFKYVFLQFIFFAPSLGANPVGFNDLFQMQLFPFSLGYGMANNIWAEMLSSGGWLLFFWFVAFYVGTLAVASSALRIVHPELRMLTALLSSFWVFYIHRNDMFTELNILKRAGLLGLVCILMSVLATYAVRRGRRLVRGDGAASTR